MQAEERTVREGGATPQEFYEQFGSDQQLRQHFDRLLGEYLHQHRGGWDLSAITDVFEAIAAHRSEATVDLRPLPGGDLAVTVTFRLRPLNAAKPEQLPTLPS